MKIKKLILPAALLALLAAGYAIPEPTPVTRAADPITSEVNQDELKAAVAKFDLEQADSRAIVGVSSQPYDLKEIGTFKVTWYNATVEQCGKTDGITRSGTQATEGVTVGADWSVIPAGTEIYIEGVGWRIVEDTGNIRGKTIDVYCESYDDAIKNGVKYCKVYVKEANS